MQPEEQLLTQALRFEQVTVVPPAGGVKVILSLVALIPAAALAITSAICWIFTVQLLVPEEHELPRVEAKRAPCSIDSCNVCSVNMANDMLAIEKSRNINGIPSSVNSKVWLPR